MSNLTKALERLDYWLYDNEPEIFESLPPGLNLEQIEEESYSLLFDLPEDIQELYLWRNGGRALFYSNYTASEGLAYLPLKEAVSQTHDTGAYIDNFLEEKQINNAFFMFREFERWIHFINYNNQGYSPILCLTDDSSLRLAYTNLTNMVLTTVESYEEGILTFSRFGGIQLNDRDIYKKILIKNNLDRDNIRQNYRIKSPIQN